MKAIGTIAAAWAIVSVLIGFLGAAQLKRTWRSRAEAELLHLSQAVQMIVTRTGWSGPGREIAQVEDSPRWRRMQEGLGISVSFVFRLSADAEQNFQWSLRPDGSYQLQTEIPWQPEEGSRVIQEQRPIAGLLVSDVLSPPAEVATWWFAWITLNAVGLCCAIGGWWYVRAESMSIQRLMDPWVASLQRRQRDSPQLLTEIEQPNSRLGTAMAIVAESVNRVYTELNNTTERSELVFGNLREGVLAVDDEGRVLLANRSLRRLLELPNEKYLYRPLLEIVRTPVICNLVQAVLKDASPRDQHVEFGNAPTYLHILARPLPLEHRRHGALLTMRDETMIKRVELIRRDFVANASHELKTPLAAIRAYAETLQLGALQDPQAAADFVGKIVAQADRLNTLVQGMLQLSRAEVGGALDFQLFDAEEAIQPCLASALAVAHSKGVEVTLNGPPEPLLLESDRDGFQTIASNLLSNAVRYTTSGGSVRVDLARHQSDLTLEVADTGIGMSSEDLERVFERFYRAHKDRSSDTGGTGLGLAMVKHLTQALGGSVHATSEPNLGSTFLVRLPLRRVTD